MEEIEGQKIKSLRRLTRKELFNTGFDSNDNCIAIELENGIILYPSRDEEGNGPGMFCGYTPGKGNFGVY